jgi:urocanate hydratase
MYRFRPDYEMRARPIEESWEMRTGKGYYADDPEPRLCRGATSSRTNHIWWKRSCFSKLGTYLLTMKYLSEMTDEQTLTMYSGHPMGLFPSHKEAPRVTNGMVIPNYSKPDDWENECLRRITIRQMTAGSICT